MTGISTPITALLAAGAVAAGGVLDTDSTGLAGSAPPTAVVIDAASGRDGRELVAEELRAVDAAVRLPRSPAEARTDLRYLAAQGYRLVVAGPDSGAAAAATGVTAVRAPDLAGALAAIETRAQGTGAQAR
jgi:hypothetical protein